MEKWFKKLKQIQVILALLQMQSASRGHVYVWGPQKIELKVNVNNTNYLDLSC